MYKSPLVCSLAELDYAIKGLSDPQNDKVIEPFSTGLNHYKIEKVVLDRIEEVTAVEYRTIGDFILSVMPNEEDKNLKRVINLIYLAVIVQFVVAILALFGIKIK